MYQHHIMLKTEQPLDQQVAIAWYEVVKMLSPENIIYSYSSGTQDVAMEYGVRETEELPHCYTIPLTRDLTPEEAGIILEGWETVFAEDFDIEISNLYNEADPYEIEIDESLLQIAENDMGKWHHNRWVHQMMREGWHYGLYFSESKKSHPALKEWDSLPEQYRRKPEFTNKEILNWLSKTI